MATSLNNSAWVEWMSGLLGGVPRQTHTATLPQELYCCLLDELPLHLVPWPARRLLLREEPSRESFVLNPECVLCAGDDMPGELQSNSELLSGFALQGTIAWVRDRNRRGLLPFWLGPRLEAIVRSLLPNEPISSAVSTADQKLLAAAGILISSIRELPFTPDEPSAHLKQQFQQKGYVALPQLIHPFHVAALRRYYRNRIRCGAISLGDRQSARRYAVHNEPVARFFHHHIASLMSALAGEEVKPSYVYLASYLSGADLKKHTDREQCEFSVTFCLDYSPEPAAATSWPISLQTENGTVTVYQALGDGLAYRGTRLPHYRGVLGEHQTSTSIFFHYVRADFDGPLS